MSSIFLTCSAVSPVTLMSLSARMVTSACSGTLLRAGLHQLPPGREVGVVAGCRPVGVGRVFGDFDGPSDGTVQVWETHLPGLADHRIVPVTHTGLVFSRDVAVLTSAFLADGHFPGAV